MEVGIVRVGLAVPPLGLLLLTVAAGLFVVCELLRHAPHAR